MMIKEKEHLFLKALQSIFSPCEVRYERSNEIMMLPRQEGIRNFRFVTFKMPEMIPTSELDEAFKRYFNPAVLALKNEIVKDALAGKKLLPLIMFKISYSLSEGAEIYLIGYYIT